jgi:hypothetical protein
VVGERAPEGAAVTALAGRWREAADERLFVDGRQTPLVLWYRAFSADARLGDAALIYARDLNVYRNPHALPRAWFASAVHVVPPAQHLDRLVETQFDPRQQAVVDRAPGVPPSATARVRSIDVSQPDRREIAVEAPEGGVLIVSERAARGWSAAVDGHPTPLVRADAVLMALGVPAGSQRVVLSFEYPMFRQAALVSVVALVAALGILVATFRTQRMRRNTPAPLDALASPEMH